MDLDVTKKLKGSDGTALPVGYDIAKGDTGHLVLEASKSLEQNIDGLTDGTHGNTKADCHTQWGNGSKSMSSSDNDAKVRTQDDRQMKREKRKQANRESARRSRMRKQAEYDELVKACDSLNMAQMALKSEIEELKAYSEKLMLENAALREKLEIAQALPQGGLASVKIEVDLDLPNDAGNILSNLASVSRNAQLDRETHKSSMSETMLHAVAAR